MRSEAIDWIRWPGVQAYELQFRARGKCSMKRLLPAKPRDSEELHGATSHSGRIRRNAIAGPASFRSWPAAGGGIVFPAIGRRARRRRNSSPNYRLSWRAATSVLVISTRNSGGAIKTKYKDSKTTINVAGKKVNLFSDDARRSRGFRRTLASRRFQNWKNCRIGKSIEEMPLAMPKALAGCPC